MSAVIEEIGEHYLVSHGKSGGVGHFRTAQALLLRRGDRVVIQSARGQEIGVVLCPANIRQARIFGAISTGDILRAVNDTDEETVCRSKSRASQVYQESRLLAHSLSLDIEVLDVETLFENQAVIHFVGNSQTALESFAEKLEEKFGIKIVLENLADHYSADDHGCGKPDCGKGAGGCSSCGSSGGCSSCGATDLKPYFAHLREKMEKSDRTSLV